MPRDDDPLDGSFDDGDDDLPTGIPFRPDPPPPDDRLWRHPSEVGATRSARPLTIVSRTVNTPKAWLIALMAGLAGSALTLATVLALGAFRPASTPPAGVEKQSVDSDRNPDAPIAIAQKVLPAVAKIEVRTASGSTKGTAVMFRSNGYLITTADLVDGAEAIDVMFGDSPAVPAELKGSDRESDIAVIKIEGTDLPVAVLGRSEGVQLGEPVIAIDSSPADSGPPSIPVGVVNALGRRVESDNPNVVTLYDMLQTNLRLSSSATGAPLIDSSGAVIGVITSRGHREPKTALATAAQATSTVPGRGPDDELVVRFATPIDYARQVADSLIRPPGKVEHAYLGAAGESLSADDARRLDIAGGLELTNVADNSPAATGPTRLQVGDVVVKLQDDTITSWDDLVVALRKHRPGDTVAVWYLRSGQTDRDPAIVTLGERPTAGK